MEKLHISPRFQKEQQEMMDGWMGGWIDGLQK
jgi:hypothetical protein